MLKFKDLVEDNLCVLPDKGNSFFRYENWDGTSRIYLQDEPIYVISIKEAWNGSRILAIGRGCLDAGKGPFLKPGDHSRLPHLSVRDAWGQDGSNERMILAYFLAFDLNLVRGTTLSSHKGSDILEVEARAMLDGVKLTLEHLVDQLQIVADSAILIAALKDSSVCATFTNGTLPTIARVFLG
ncbi:hypothetical protein ACH5RR_003314 [Cinchona calisaya]|uniref:RNase H type-1 domain-containing protein n=1 Tax=Cinchona calisaya TaxID=153742 RepID=A0ABD3AUL8_9GENT